MTLKSSLSNAVKSVQRLLSKNFDKKRLCLLARCTSFVERSTSQLKGDELVRALVIVGGSGHGPVLSKLLDLVNGSDTDIQISKQALHKRLQKEGILNLMKAVFAETIDNLKGHFDTPIAEEYRDHADASKAAPGLFDAFGSVYLQDSTECALAPSLAAEFKGSGGGCGDGRGNAAFKTDVIFEYKQREIVSLYLADRRKPDVVLGREHLPPLAPNDLCLRDLGYFTVENLGLIQDAEAFYLSRMLLNLSVYLTPECTEPLDLPTLVFDCLKEGRDYLDVDVCITSKKFATRLIAYKVPRQVRLKRIRVYKKSCKKRGSKPSDSFIQRLGFNFLLTNVSREVWTPHQAAIAYTIRWYIEIIFRVWKMQLGYDNLTWSQPNSMKCLIYGRLIFVLLLSRIHSRLQRVTTHYEDRNISLAKLAKWLLLSDRIARILTSPGGNAAWKMILGGTLRELYLDRRKSRRSLPEREQESVSLEDLYPKVSQDKDLMTA